jgi:predicted RNase H-like nuclease (RuvC/YqgF family)
METLLIDRLENRIEALLAELGRLRTEQARLENELEGHRCERQELAWLRQHCVGLESRLQDQERKLAEAPEPRLLAELRARVAALVQKLEAAAEPALLEPGPSAGPGSDTEGMA